MASSRALLSPHEECALRRIILGVPGAELRAEHLRRLIALDLVNMVNDELIVTEAGMHRCRDLPRLPVQAPRRPPALEIANTAVPEARRDPGSATVSAVASSLGGPQP